MSPGAESKRHGVDVLTVDPASLTETGRQFVEERTRQLTAIMFADMVGYTALMQEDEERAHAQRERQREVLSEIVPRHGGEILQYYGDGTLSLFNSAVEAVKCAVEIQLEMRKQPEVPLRIGVHIGDIVHDRDGVYGDGVNVAARIEALSASGGVLISGKVFAEIKNHPSLSTVSFGEIRLKSLKQPEKVFAITNEGLSVPTEPQMRAKAAGGRAGTFAATGEGSAEELDGQALAVAGAAPLGPEARQKTIDVLRESFAGDEIDVEEFEKRVELVHRAESIEQLWAILADLRTADLPVPSVGLAPRPMRTPERIPGHSLMVGIIGSGKRVGAWVPARHNWVVNLIGGYVLDFREAQLGPGVTDVHLFAVIGGTKVLVPPDVRVECSGIGIIGGFGHEETVTSTTDPEAPVIRVTGVAIIGGANVTVLYPGETARLTPGETAQVARLRLEAERKARKERGRSPE